MCLTYTRQAETGACERGPILFEDTDETQLYFFFFIGYKSCSDCVKLVPCLEVMMSWMMKKNKKRVQCNNRKQTRTGKTPKNISLPLKILTYFIESNLCFSSHF
ncbi:uncharacterized protein LOC128332022 isoform X5 [Hemicordylus capensis]|uniref:uncharacterized protein LOC128332022 isoform X5 n=1 Tax=Hemicordylus capensis TaxID=884348 RepID=UPI002302016E|nr:uncharacterized protein LOC128332022 isoform X5 [Hemicordylus capensis]